MTAADQTIVTADGYSLAATIYGDISECSAVVVIASATAVGRGFYRHYAHALAAEGLAAVTFDYRGIGGSRPASIRTMTATMRDWVLLDMQAVVDWALAAGRPVALVGHSFGGQSAGLLKNGNDIAAMLTLSAQSGHWRMQVAEQKFTVAFHLYVTFPLLINVLGYLPWSRFGAAEDLPGGVASEWARWCRNRAYLLGDATLPLHRYQRFTAPVRALSIDDDKWGSAPSVDFMMAAYPNLERRHLVPGELGVAELGHFGYFRRQSAALWTADIDWLQQHCR